MRPGLKMVRTVLERLIGQSLKGEPGQRRGAAPTRTGKAAQPADGALVIEYTPTLDGDADPGEVVWTWVPYEEDASQGKDRPVVIIGHSGGALVGVPLTSKRHDNEEQVLVGKGPWDSRGRPSYAKVERVLEIDARSVRREGAILPRDRFDAVVAAVQAHRRHSH